MFLLLRAVYPRSGREKVYLQDEERQERRERAQLAAWDRCDDKSVGGGSERVRAAAAALGPCEDDTAEMEAAAKVRQGATIGELVYIGRTQRRIYERACEFFVFRPYGWSFSFFWFAT